jgi:beta-carotene ketolase (CrtW type)
MVTSTISFKPTQIGNRGLYFAVAILLSWFGMLVFLLNYPIDWQNPLIYVFVPVQTHLYTGIFITAHDAIHGVVAPNNKRLNYGIGFLCATLFAFNNFDRLSRKHHLHHQHSATDDDPDYHDGNPGFFAWYYSFLKEYISVVQIVLMAITYNILKIWFPMENLILFWMVPAILSTFQLFYFGTYQPHRGEHHNPPHNARSQKLNHLTAFLSCYFFGYHAEHHAWPYLPWWKLPAARERELRIKSDE